MALNDSEKYISGAILQGCGTPNALNNKPMRYADREHQYMAGRTRQFSAVRAKYATDYVQARVQGISPKDFYKWYRTHVRLSDMHSTPTATQQPDDTKIVLFDEPKIDYFPIGAKLETMGSTWICTNPSNLSSTLTSAVVRRCNTSYNLYDFYGNIITEPIILEKVTMMGNDNSERPQNLVMMDGYFNVICQLNENTRQLGLNQRIILGTKAYFITGFNDFYQEFSGDYGSTNILYFTVRIEEPQENDDVPNHIANGKSYSFEAKILDGQKNMVLGDILHLTAIFFKNGVDASTIRVPYDRFYDDNMVDEVKMSANPQNGMLYAKQPTPYKGTTFSIKGQQRDFLVGETSPEMRAADFYLSDKAEAPKDGELYVTLKSYVTYPITWIWSSSNPTVATVNEKGVVTAISAGAVIITATLAQNPSITASIELAVEMSIEGSYVAFNGDIPQSIEQFNSVTLTAACYEGSAATDKIVEWKFSGADKNNYTATVKDNSVEIYCTSADDVPLTITATCDGHTSAVEIKLLGY